MYYTRPVFENLTHELSQAINSAAPSQVADCFRAGVDCSGTSGTKLSKTVSTVLGSRSTVGSGLGTVALFLLRGLR